MVKETDPQFAMNVGGFDPLPSQAIVRADATEGMGPLLQWAQTPGLNVDAIKDMVQLFREERAYQAERAFNDAMARFQSECPPIKHDREANFATKGGAKVNYTFASLAQIAKVVGPYLHKYGLSFSWDMAMNAETVTANCVVRHKDGHSRSTPFTCMAAKTELQSHAQSMKGAQTFAQRCSLISALGLTTTDTDTDGADGNGADFITEQAALDLDALCDEVGAKRELIFKLFDVRAWSDVHAGPQCDTIIRFLEEKRKVAK